MATTASDTITITANLNSLFTYLETLAPPSQIRKACTCLLTAKHTVDMFVTRVQQITRRQTPPDFADKVRAELAQCPSYIAAVAARQASIAAAALQHAEQRLEIRRSEAGSSFDGAELDEEIEVSPLLEAWLKNIPHAIVAAPYTERLYAANRAIARLLRGDESVTSFLTQLEAITGDPDAHLYNDFITRELAQSPHHLARVAQRRDQIAASIARTKAKLHPRAPVPPMSWIPPPAHYPAYDLPPQLAAFFRGLEFRLNSSDPDGRNEFRIFYIRHIVTLLLAGEIDPDTFHHTLELIYRKPNNHGDGVVMPSCCTYQGDVTIIESLLLPWPPYIAACEARHARIKAAIDAHNAATGAPDPFFHK